MKYCRVLSWRKSGIFWGRNNFTCISIFSSYTRLFLPIYLKLFTNDLLLSQPPSRWMPSSFKPNKTWFRTWPVPRSRPLVARVPRSRALRYPRSWKLVSTCFAALASKCVVPSFVNEIFRIGRKFGLFPFSIYRVDRALTRFPEFFTSQISGSYPIFLKWT